MRQAATVGKISHARRWVAGLTVLAIVVVAVVVLWRRVHDPRQYPGSGDHVMLSYSLDRAHLTLPECG
ncbi:hypothetical protein OHA72_56220 [Dactylosporangium sp. NBC_01737]|uniref:hypothetical protein n=1 Tax=Dactylosporangium sp. NBC_01737 TaxID=2975959 RepID=UPI002E0F5293|nr:hypothetical protein OHA72_56220 [Dactylosporangium sp. NBC_01737]